MNRKRQSHKEKKKKEKEKKTNKNCTDHVGPGRKGGREGNSRLHILRIPAKRCAVMPKDAAIKEEDALVVETDGAVHCYM